ncbi:hypothetical protein L6164_002246 [Bauhinia variegata]|uniref:Uncharacterized protein n=1 Tax=Bauhinia variegata TaxID=167791 RepID=A0ACB9PZF5_BAUVA|nr:hypothetical protein L6164_002246 [Bauhinia variegata]
MGDHILGPNQRKRRNAFGEFVDKPLGFPPSSADADAAGDHGQKKLKLNSEAPLSTMDKPLFPALPLPNQLQSAFMDNPTGSIKFQLFARRSYCPSSASLPPVYILEVTSASNGEVDTAGKGVEGAAKPVLKETRLVAEGKFMLRSRI